MSRLPTSNHMNNPAMPRYSTVHSNSSAFSASAGPNEDWTKISDLAERRRIQNRIAQRNYRKKLKRRLEDLERRAGSTSASPEPEEEEEEEQQQHQQRAVTPTTSRPRAHTLGAIPSATRRRTSSNTLQHHFLPSSYDESNILPYQTRHQSPAPSSVFSQPAFSSAETNYTPSYSYSSSSSYASPSVTAAETPCYGAYTLTTRTPMSSVTMNNSTAVKNEQFDEEYNTFPGGYSPVGFDSSYTKTGFYCETSETTPFTPSFSESDFTDSFPSSLTGSPPMSMWALYPSPPASVAEDDPPIFSLPLDLALDEPDFFRML